MIGVSRLLCGTASAGDALRYAHRAASPNRPQRRGEERKPIVVWNSTLACNLSCQHCYYAAGRAPDSEEMRTDAARAMIDDLAVFGVPVLLFSGGEPLLRDDLMELGAYAVSRGLRIVISTNGTLIRRETAQRIREAGFAYVGVSLDGLRETNDRFRGVQGAYDAALAGMRHCMAAGLRVGLRLTLHQHNVPDLHAIFGLVEAEGIQRACFYHLVYAGRGRRLRQQDLDLEGTRRAVDIIFDRTEDLHARGKHVEVLTVDNHADAPYLLERVRQRQPERYDEVLQLLRGNGGNASGITIAAIDHRGNVHPDQFWQHYTLGNIRQRPFGEIWTDTGDALLAGLKHRQPLLEGRCARCKHLAICNDNLRVRAEAVSGDVWAPDPACYLTDEEVLA